MKKSIIDFACALKEMRDNPQTITIGLTDRIFYKIKIEQNRYNNHMYSLYKREYHHGLWIVCDSKCFTLFDQRYSIVKNDERISQIKEEILYTKTWNGDTFSIEINKDVIEVSRSGITTPFPSSVPLNVSFEEFKNIFKNLIPVYHYLVELALILTKEIVY